MAFDTGYRDGSGTGSEDFGDGKKYHPEKHDSYEDAHHGYRKSYGPMYQYKERSARGFCVDTTVLLTAEDNSL